MSAFETGHLTAACFKLWVKVSSLECSERLSFEILNYTHI